MCEFYEWYIKELVDFNDTCEKGDCYMILNKHRHEFLNYRTTKRQIFWLYQQFLPNWLTGVGLGHGSSSGKSIEETTKEIDEHYNKGNDVFSCILGKAMVYTCGIFHEVHIITFLFACPFLHLCPPAAILHLICRLTSDFPP
jgi:hypothetical protein